MLHPEAQYDLLVVGAGPAGASAAKTAAAEGIKVLLIDSKRRIGEPPHCGEFVPSLLFTECGLDRASVVQRVTSMETRVIECPLFQRFSESNFEGFVNSSGSSFSKRTSEEPDQITLTNSNGYMIDRVRFDRDLSREAAASGATVLCCSRFIEFQEESCVVKFDSEETRVHTKFVIAADGAMSRVASVLGFASPEVLKGIQVQVSLSTPLDRTVIFLHREFRGGYGWLFPKGKLANVGVGVVCNQEVRSKVILKNFVKLLLDQAMISWGIFAVSGGLIPVSGLRESLVRGNVLFAGDAAGLTHPITGAGIPQAVISGELAGLAVAMAVKTGDRKYLSDYEIEIKGRYSGVIAHALSKRILMIQNWDNEDFRSMSSKTWMAFKGYRQRVRKA